MKTFKKTVAPFIIIVTIVCFAVMEMIG